MYIRVIDNNLYNYDRVRICSALLGRARGVLAPGTRALFLRCFSGRRRGDLVLLFALKGRQFGPRLRVLDRRPLNGRLLAPLVFAAERFRVRDA